MFRTLFSKFGHPYNTVFPQQVMDDITFAFSLYDLKLFSKR
jgi:hypothetical protein